MEAYSELTSLKVILTIIQAAGCWVQEITIENPDEY